MIEKYGSVGYSSVTWSHLLMEEIAASLAGATSGVSQVAVRPRSQAKRSRIIGAAMQHFAENGYHAARVGDIAATLGIAKGSIFQYFGNKQGLFLEVYKYAARSFPKYLDAPAYVRAAGFFDVLYYWLVRTKHLLRHDWVSYRISLLGAYGADLSLKYEIIRFLAAEDPYGTLDFVRFGLSRGELRKDMDIEMIISVLDWNMERFQNALMNSELDTGLFHKRGAVTPETKQVRIQQFLSVLRRAIGSPQSPVRRRNDAQKTATASLAARAKLDKTT